MAADDGIAWIGARWPDDDADPLLGVQAGLVFAEGIAPQDLAVVFGAVPWEMPEPVGAEAKAVWDRTHPCTRVPDEPLLTVYGKEGEWSFLAGHFDYLVPFREDFALPRGTGRAVLLYNIAAKGMSLMACFEGGREVWHGEIPGGSGSRQGAGEPAFLDQAVREACRGEGGHRSGDWRKRFLGSLGTAFGFSVCQETFDAGGYPLAAVHLS
ncbi:MULTISPECIES: hypothetical protein [unclassified Streptomyces]|uniref:hypothetical protein n=1 Tax=unclassified Streptomyces TaxID=2593676 RepID=UPI00380661F7